MICVSRMVSKSTWFPVPMVKLISWEVVVPMHANVLIHLDKQLAQENKWNHLDD